MPQPSAQVTAAEISRIAGVTRATVSNWRRRHEDFPAPSGGTEGSPLYDLRDVRVWLASRGHASVAGPSEELRTTLRIHRQGSGSGTSDLLLLVLGAAGHSPKALTAAVQLPDAELVARAEHHAAAFADAVPGGDRVRFGAIDVAVLRALYACVRNEGPQSAVDVLATRELEDSVVTGAYRTPGPLSELVARLIPGAPARVLDPACGSGSLLTAAAHRGARELYGQDVLTVQARRAAVTLTLTAPEATVAVHSGDTLRADAFPGLLADAVLCNPPFGNRDWGHDELAYDPRWAYGVPTRADSELAWVQHALAHLVPGGYAVLILPPATAGRASGRRVRAELVRGGALRAVIALPVGASMPLHVGLQIWILQRPEPGGPEHTSTLFVDAAQAAATPPGRDGTSVSPRTRAAGRSASVDWADITERVLGAWQAFTENPNAFEGEPGVARAVGVVDLLDGLVDLTPARLVRASRAGVDPAQLAEEADVRRRDLAKAARALGRAAGYEDWSAAGASAREWRTATVSDLARGGALTLLRTMPEGARGRTGDGDGDPEALAGRPVLTVSDLARDSGPTGSPTDLPAGTTPVIAAGDVLMPVAADAPGPAARVAGEDEAGALLGPHIHLFRPDPARLGSWFLAGFLGTEENIAGASTGSSVRSVAPGRLRVPLLPLEEQRRYGEAFRRLHELRAKARRAVRLAEETARLLSDGLTGGQLLPQRDAGTATRSWGGDSPR